MANVDISDYITSLAKMITESLAVTEKPRDAFLYLKCCTYTHPSTLIVKFVIVLYFSCFRVYSHGLMQWLHLK